MRCGATERRRSNRPRTHNPTMSKATTADETETTERTDDAEITEQCVALTGAGKRCSNAVSGMTDTPFCSSHDKADDVERYDADDADDADDGTDDADDGTDDADDGTEETPEVRFKVVRFDPQEVEETMRELEEEGEEHTRDSVIDSLKESIHGRPYKYRNNARKRAVELEERPDRSYTYRVEEVEG